MSLLESLDDDIADILGSDNEELSRVRNYSENSLLNDDKTKTKTKKKKDITDRNSKSEKKSLKMDKKIKRKREKNKKEEMFHSQSNGSLPSGNTDISESTQISMSREEALLLLQSESLKNLNQSKSNSKSITKTESVIKPIKKSLNSDDNLSSLSSSPISKNKKSETSNSSDNESNDSILDWLDEPRINDKNKRKALLSKISKNNDKLENNDISKNIEQWKEWLGLNSDKIEDKEYIYLAENAAKSILPNDWEKVNDNLYHNIRTNERTMTHPLLQNVENELKLLRNKKDNNSSNSTNSTSLSSLKVNTNIPLRQIDTSSNIHSSTNNIKTQITTINNNNNDESISEMYHKQESESLIIKNLKMELNETRHRLSRLMKDKTNLIEDIERINNKTEIMLNEQKLRLNKSYKMEIDELQKENDKLRELNNKLINEHQTEIIDLESNIRENGLKEKQKRLNELSLIEQRCRDELGHKMDLHRETIHELKKQHQNEIEILNKMHEKQLENFRKQQKNEGQLNLLINKMETSTVNLQRLQKDIFIERDSKHKERENQIEIKEKLLSEKDYDLLRERKAHRELLEKFQSLVQETKIEKIAIREAQNKLKNREEEILKDLTDSNHEINVQRDILNEERRKFELNKSRWDKQKQNELDDIQRLKIEHTKTIQTFYEEQEIERSRISKQRQILNDDKSKFIKIKKQFDVEKEHFDEIKLNLEEKKHKLQIERSDFERKVHDVTGLSHRVYQQSEVVKKMYNDSKQMEEENNLIQLQLISQVKEIKIMKQQLLMEKNQIMNERKILEQEQLSLLTKKRDIIQQIDTMKVLEQQTLINQKLLYHDNNNNNNNNNNHHHHNNENIFNLSNKHKNKNNHYNQNLNKINSELQELKDFVNECHQNISNYKEDLNNFKHKRRDSFHSQNNKHSHFNRLTMSFPSFSNKSSSSFISHSMQNSHSRSLKSFTSTLSSKMSANNNNNNNKNDDNINDLSKIDIINNDNNDITQTPIIPKNIRNNLNTFNNTDNTLQSSFVSMVNIDTPITIDNKTKKYIKKTKILQQQDTYNQDSTLPMTPKPMPNLSKIDIMEEVDDFDDDDYMENENKNELENDQQTKH